MNAASVYDGIEAVPGHRLPQTHGVTSSATHNAASEAAAPQPAEPDDHLWTIVLAAGEGTRLHTLTRALHGENLPKQFAAIREHESLLQATVNRAKRWSLTSRTMVVVAREREALARAQLAEHEDIQIVAQPLNRGTGPGVLLPIARVVEKDPDAHVVVLPSDHFVGDEAVFRESVRHAERTARGNGSVVLVGAVPDSPETDYGWIVSASHAPGGMAVSQFVEKPAAHVAARLLTTGALWNTFVMAGAARRFWELGCTHLPLHGPLLDSYRQVIGTDAEAQVLERIYHHMPSADFSRNVLESASGLGIVALKPCGWSDWGTPERVLRSLRGSREYTTLTSRIGAFGAARSVTPELALAL